MKTKYQIISCFFLIGLFLYPASAKAEDTAAPSAPIQSQKKEKTDKVVAKVNATEIKESELMEAMNAAMSRNPQLRSMMGSKDGMKALKKNALEQAISTELLLQEGRKLNNKNLTKQVDEEYNKFKSKFPNDEDFKRALSQRDISETSLRKRIEKGISIRNLIDNKITKNISIPEEEVKSFYTTNKDKFVDQEEVKASHILIKVAKDADKAEADKALKKIEALLKRAKGGEDFATLAKENSEDPSAAQNSGNLGYFNRKQMVPEFSKVAFALKVGEISDPVRTSFGYHIIKFEDKKAKRDVPYKEVSVKIAQYLKDRAMQSKVSDYIASLKKTAKIEILLK